MKLLIMGASNGIGLETTKLALEQGYNVRAFARSASSMQIGDPLLERFSGDALKQEDVASALTGVDAVVQALGVPANFKMVSGPITLFSKATATLVPLMQEAGVKRLIAVTGFGAGDAYDRVPFWQRPAFNLLLGRAYADKDIQESLIRQSDLDWVIARPGILTGGRRTGRYRVLLEPEEWRNGLISRADVADFLMRQTGDDAHLGKTPVLIY